MSFPVKDQGANTVVCLLIERVICCYGAPEWLLFWLWLHLPVTTLPQMDGLVKRFHQTPVSTLSMYIQRHGRDWDCYLPHMLCAYRVTAQESMRAASFLCSVGTCVNQWMKPWAAHWLHTRLQIRTSPWTHRRMVSCKTVHSVCSESTKKIYWSIVLATESRCICHISEQAKLIY